MATEGFMHRLPPPPPPAGVPFSQPSSGAAPSVQQESGSVPPPPPPQPPLFPRPVFYMHAPPPPPPHLLHQWPMPYYHPYMGFPGSGYGMVMPPFLPPSYLEPSAYILPHLQPVDYRRLPHPPVNAPVPSQQPQNQQHRPRPPPVRETISIEVQTDPTHRMEGGFDDGRSDSGHGTASNASSPSSSSSKKEVKDSTRPHCNNTESSQNPKQGSTHPVESFLNAAQAMQQCRNAAVQEPPLVLAHYNMLSESSPDGIVPVLCSSQREEGVEERRRSVPDILMLKITDEVPTQNPPLYNTETECEKSVFQSLDTKHGAVVDEISRIHDDEMLFKILRFPSSSMFRSDSLSFSYNPDEFLSRDESHGPETDTTLNDDPAELRRHHVTSRIHRRSKKLNDSVWSVESLEPYVMSREWLLLNNFLEQPIIVDEEGAEGETDFLAKPCGDTPRGYHARSSDILSMNGIDFSTPAGKCDSPEKPQNQSEIDEGELKDKDGQEEEEGSPILLQNKSPSTPVNKEIHENSSFEVTQTQVQQEKSPKTFNLDPETKTTPKRVMNLQRTAGAEDETDVPPEKRATPNPPRMADKGMEPLKLLDYAIQCDLCGCALHKIGIGPEGTSRCSGQVGITSAECRIQEGLPRNGRKSKKENYRNRNQNVNGRSRY